MSKFELNPTVNESGNSILLKLRILEKHKIAHQNTRNNVRYHSFM